MAAFQITITPPIKKAVKTEKAMVYVTPKLILAPFNPTPEVTFGSVTVNAKITKPLIIYNPTLQSITVQLKNIDPDDRISLSDSNVQLNAEEEKEIYISWSPLQSGYLRKVIRVQDACRKSRSFDVILNGTCVCSKALDKKKRLKNETNKSKLGISGQKKVDRNVPSYKSVDADIRRQTYLIEEKENCAPNGIRSDGSAIFRTSSPKYQNSNITSYFGDDLPLFDHTDVCTKYSNFESELKFTADMSSLHSNDGTNSCRRGTYTLNSEEVVKNPFSLSSVDELDGSLSGATNFYDSLCRGNAKTPNEKNVTFESNHTPENVRLTPIKSLSCLLTPAAEFPDLFETPRTSTNCNITHDLLNDSSPSATRKNDFIFISPPTKAKSSKVSPDRIIVRHHVSSAISDRKRHLKTNILPRRKTPPSALKLSKAIPSIEKMKTQDPSSLKQVLRSHIDDPFLKQSLYCDENWIDCQEKDIIKWMNSLLTPPVELNEETDWTVDAAAVWLQSRRDGNLRAVPSIDNIAAAVYHSPQRFDTLRKVASSLLASEPVRSVFSKIANVVQKKIISVREDRDLHLDQSLKNKLMQLLSCYNPLWLQIALEAIYDQKITLQPKADVGGLGWFIRKHVLTSSISNKKNAHPAVLQMTKPNFKDQVKKYILQKFLCLVYFLDQAKMRKLIRHNPCLFVSKSEYKSSQDLLLAFCSDLVVGRGDIIKHLKAIDYVLQYKQTCIDEYDYSITSLHDLKDGVRLTRLFEILFHEADLCSKLRVPAISLLQKIYNVSVAMKVAEKKCTIEGDIQPKEIVNGHREKMLSFLWQIINNYLKPLYEKSAITIQRWWRKQVLPKLLEKKQQERELHASATIIQTAWRGFVCKRKYASFYAQIKEENLKLQTAAVTLQRRFRAIREVRKQREMYVATIFACIKLQTWWRCESQRRKFLSMKWKITSIQRRFRANREMKRQQKYFIRLRQSAIIIQRLFRANREMRIQRNDFLNMKKSATVIQTIFRANLKAKVERLQYLNTKTAAIRIQTQFRSYRRMKHDRQSYRKLRTNVTYIQRKYRAFCAMKVEQSHYNDLKSASICIQRRFRAHKMMKKQHYEFMKLKSTVVYLQRKYRATILMKRERSEFLKLKNAAVLIQQKFRANRLMTSVQLEYQTLKNCCILIQNRFKSKKLMKSERCEYLKLKEVVINVQRLFRMRRQLRLDCCRFERIRQSVLLIQRKFRAYKLAKRERELFLQFKQSVILVQQRFRSNRLMRRERDRYAQLKTHVIRMQTLFRANCVMKTERAHYLELTNAVIVIQIRFRANRLMKQKLKQYSELKFAVVLIQRKFRANFDMKTERKRYLQLKKACVSIQRQLRANFVMKIQRDIYVNLKKNVIFLQQRVKANRAMRLERTRYQNFKKSVLTVQRKYRAISLMREQRDYFIRLKNAVAFVQRTYKAKLLMRRKRNEFLSLKSATLTVQKIFRTNRRMKIQRQDFVNIKKASITIQRKYRAWKAMRTIRKEFLRVTIATLVIQNWYRAQICRKRFLIMRKAAVIVQSKYRALNEMRPHRLNYLKLKYIACIIQTRYRVAKQTGELMRKFVANCDVKFNNYSLEGMVAGSSDLTRCKIISFRDAKEDRMRFITLKITTIFIQRRFRNELHKRAQKMRMEIEAAELGAARESAVTKIQALWRGYLVRKRKVKKPRSSVVAKKTNPNLDTNVILAERYKKAILQLKTSDMYDVITHALWNLESVTMLSAKLCEGVAAEGIIPIIFYLMARGNRSEPSLEIYRAGCSILINLARHKPTKVVLWETINKVDDIFLILHIMKITHDKLLVPVFCFAATLLWLLCQDVSVARAVGSLYSFQQQIEKMLEKLKRINLKTSQTKKISKTLPRIESNWFPDPQHRIFENNYVAINNLHRILYQ